MAHFKAAQPRARNFADFAGWRGELMAPGGGSSHHGALFPAKFAQLKAARTGVRNFANCAGSGEECAPGASRFLVLQLRPKLF